MACGSRGALRLGLHYDFVVIACSEPVGISHSGAAAHFAFLVLFVGGLENTGIWPMCFVSFLAYIDFPKPQENPPDLYQFSISI
ncbi:MAG: hypothetical protein WC028_27770 [Candidatus Obscuribacterales bacterium]